MREGVSGFGTFGAFGASRTPLFFVKAQSAATGCKRPSASGLRLVVNVSDAPSKAVPISDIPTLLMPVSVTSVTPSLLKSR